MIVETSRQSDGTITVNGAVCGEATMSNTATVNVEGGDLGTGESVTIDIANGASPATAARVAAKIEGAGSRNQRRLFSKLQPEFGAVRTSTGLTAGVQAPLKSDSRPAGRESFVCGQRG